MGYNRFATPYTGHTVRLNVAGEMTPDELKNLLVDSLGARTGQAVYQLWTLADGTIDKAHGSYHVEQGERPFALAHRLLKGRQDPVRLTVRNSRSIEKATSQIASNFDFTNDDFARALDSVAAARGVNAAGEIALLMPDTYEFYWTAPASKVADDLASEWEAFWNPARRAKASSLGLSPLDVATVASIVEEETARADERPVVARLYLNRLSRGMKLQADPTVKYAVGDPTLRRIKGEHLAVNSPYNTYLHVGLPPGPIRMVDKATLDAVLDAPSHNYIYMCAREDFSGRHNFTDDYSVHMANARRYQQALNHLNIQQ